MSVTGLPALDAFLVVLAALLPIVNPIGSAPIFLALTQGSTTPAERNALAPRIALNALLILVVSLFAGSYILQFFGIGLPMVRIAGGVLLASLGWRLLNSDTSPDAEDHASARAHTHAPESFYPLTLPLTVGPGCIAIVITFGAQRPPLPGLEELLLLRAAQVGSLLVVCLTVLVCYRYADRIVAWLGHAGASVVMRLSAFILLCIGLEIAWTGFRALSAAH